MPTWTTPRTWSAGEVVTAANLNEQVRDNTEHLFNGINDIVYFEHRESASTGGGGFSSGAWRVRDITNMPTDSGNIASLASDQITLEPGKYRTFIVATATQVNGHQARLYDDTAASVLLYGTVSWSSTSADENSDSIIMGDFTLTTQSALQVEHQCSETNATDGMGKPISWGRNIYLYGYFVRIRETS